MPMPATKRLFNADEFERMGQCGILSEDDRVELIEGEIVTMAPIGSEHAGHVDRLAHPFHGNLGGRAIVRVQNPIQLGDRSEPQPDVALLRHRSDFYTQRHPEAADIFLIVEVAETSVEYDRDVKVPLYARWRIPAVWLINLPDRQLEIYREPTEGSYRCQEMPAAEDELAVEGLTGFAVRASAILPAMKGHPR